MYTRLLAPTSHFYRSNIICLTHSSSTYTWSCQATKRLNETQTPLSQQFRFASSKSRFNGLIPPLPAFTLGAGGLIPFFAPPLYMMYNNGVFCADGEFIHLVYSASILAFLGGVRWGHTLPDKSTEGPTWKNLTYSITPPLLAWVGVFLQSPLGYIPITAGIVACGVIDLVWPGYPIWFKILRVLLTTGALLSTFLLFKVKYDNYQSFGVTESINGFKEKYYNRKNDSREK